MGKKSTYNYNVELTYVNGNKQTEIDPKAVSMITIDYNYERNNAAVIYMNVNLKVPLYNEMILNSKSAKLYLNIKIYNDGQSNSIKKNYIKEQFSYFLKDDKIETDEDLIKSSESSGTSYKRVTLGLIKSELIDYNKITINNIFRNTNTSSILHYYTNRMNMIIEPFDNNPVHDIFIIPPIEGITKLIKFLNESCAFYNTSYRYFMDFSTTYLLSSKGKAINIKDGTYDTIKIAIVDDDGTTRSNDGIDIDNTKKIYTIEVDPKNFSLNMNKTTDMRFNKIYGVDSLGNSKSTKLNINNRKNSSAKTRVIRVYNNNLDYIDNLASEVNNTSAIISVTKANIDCSLIVPYKEYRISNVKQYSDLDGKYILVNKREVLIQSEGDFACSIAMSFKKVS